MTEAIAAGVYFDLPEEDYHADTALSASGIKNLNVSPLTFWDRNINPDKEDKKSSAMVEGTAYHKRILEGKNAFEGAYTQDIVKDDFGGLLETAEDLKGWLKARELPVTGRKDALIERVLEHDKDAQVWDYLKHKHAEANEGRETISKDLWGRIEFAAEMIDRHPQIEFSDGYPEVSIFWDDEVTHTATGEVYQCRRKARIDWLEADKLIDLKTFNTQGDRPINKTIMQAIVNNRYQIPAVYYAMAVSAARKMPDSAFHGGDAGFIKEFKKEKPPVFYWVFLGADLPHLRLLSFPYFEGVDSGPKSLVCKSAQDAIKVSSEAYCDRMARYTDPAMPWFDEEPLKMLDDIDFPIWALE